MTAEALDYRRHVRRPIGFVVFGTLLLVLAGYLMYDAAKRRNDLQPVGTAYTYTVTQSVDKTVQYVPNSFYTGGPAQNTAYVRELTDTIRMVFHYKLSGSEPELLAYAYDVRAVVRGTYSLKGNDTDLSNVWSKDFQLLAPVHGTETASSLSFDPTVTVPYAEYRKQIEQLRSSLTLPISSDVTVTFTINVSGVIDGKPFNDLRTVSITAPIDQSIYTFSQKYDAQDTKQVIPASAQAKIDQTAQLETYGVVALGALALASFVYGLRRQIFKTPYQRELDKIYRYHDGIIVRAGRSADVSGKHVVPVRSFDDMLNLEEELKLPIVAVPAGPEATQFMIMRDDVAYIYTLGILPRRQAGPSLEQLDETIGKRLGHKPRRKVQ